MIHYYAAGSYHSLGISLSSASYSIRKYFFKNFNFYAKTSTSALCFSPFSRRCVKYFWLRVWNALLRTRLIS